jgi:pyruvate/2-oxoglutarate/acetoin dehydrogenase E1 component
MRELTYSQALREALIEEMERDSGVLLLGEDIGVYGGVFKVTDGLLDRFGPERVIETPISESGFTGVAVGLALCGKKPMAEIMFMDFAWVAADQIWNQAAKMRQMSGGQVSVPMVIRTQQGGGRGNAAQHSQNLEAQFTHIPGIKVALPATPYDAKGLLKSALRDPDPVIVIEHKLLYGTKGPVPEAEYLIPFGAADIKREGNDVTVITFSRMVLQALEAAEVLSGEGIDVEVIDLRTTVPLDIAAVVRSVKKTHRVVVAHEAHKNCGVGAEIVARIMEQAFDELDAPIARVAALDVPVPYSQPLEQKVLPDAGDIVAAVRRFF